MIFNIDVDNTINNFVQHFLFLYNDISGRHIEYEDIADYDLTSIGISRYTLETLFFRNNRFYELLVPQVGSVSTIKALIEKGHTVKFVTSIDYDVVQARIDFITRYFPAADVNKSLILTDSKQNIYADWVIDDLPSNVKDNVNENCKYILLQRPWNTEEYDEIVNIPITERNCYCCYDWMGVSKILKSLNIL